ncbi:MAG: hypothetical protein ACRDV4_09580, partial [Acidimicrobiales bacterium]
LAVGVAVLVTVAYVLGSTSSRMTLVDRDPMLVHVFAVRPVEMTVMQVIDVAFVKHRLMAATITVGVLMTFMDFVCAHTRSPRSASTTTIPIQLCR